MKFTTSLKKNHQFRAVYNKGRSFKSKNLVLIVMGNDLDINRLGVAVSKKVGNSVVRHRITRLIRESYRLFEEEINRGFDFVVVARAGAARSGFVEISAELRRLLRSAD